MATDSVLKDLISYEKILADYIVDMVKTKGYTLSQAIASLDAANRVMVLFCDSSLLEKEIENAINAG